MKKISEEWLNAAKDDLRVIEKIQSDALLTHMVAFHAQQSIEKSIKAVVEEFASRRQAHCQGCGRILCYCEKYLCYG